MDFLDSLAQIKSQMQKSSQEAQAPKAQKSKASQSAEDKQERMQAEFMDYFKNSDIKKL